MKLRLGGDPVVDAYKRDVDRSLLIENLKLSHAERLEKFERIYQSAIRLRGIARKPQALQELRQNG